MNYGAVMPRHADRVAAVVDGHWYAVKWDGWRTFGVAAIRFGGRLPGLLSAHIIKRIDRVVRRVDLP
jgi:hypothetical protein